MLTFQYNDTEIMLAFTHAKEVVELPFLVKNQVKKELRDTCTAHLKYGDKTMSAMVVRNPKEPYSLEASQKYALDKLLQFEFPDVKVKKEGKVVGKTVDNLPIRAAIWKAYHSPFQVPLPKSSGLVSEPPKLTAVDIAKDVIALLEAKKIKPITGEYCLLPSGPLGSLQQAIQDSGFYCRVCALGSLLVALVDKKNELECSDVDNTSTYMVEKLQPYFSREQLMLIEAAFEARHVGLSACEFRDPDVIAAVEFGRNVPNLNSRLQAIMENVIKNDGVFWLPEFSWTPDVPF